jgi:nucleotide-binding universal stress UspA family protein
MLGRLPLPSEGACTVLHVLEPIFEPGDLRKSQRLAAAQHLVEQTGSALAREGYEVDRRVHEGHAAQQILRIAQDQDVDLVVLGARGLTGIREFLLGSVSGRVLRYAPCSVLIVR